MKEADFRGNNRDNFMTVCKMDISLHGYHYYKKVQSYIDHLFTCLQLNHTQKVKTEIIHEIIYLQRIINEKTHDSDAN